MGELLEAVVSLHTVEVLFPQLVSVAVDMAADAEYDIAFLEAGYAASDLQADIPHLVEVAHILVDFGIFKLMGEHKDYAYLDLEYVARAIEVLGNVVLLNKFASDWTVFGLDMINEVEAVAEYGIVIDKAEYMFTPDMWVEENITLQAIVRTLGQFLEDNEITTINKIKAYFETEGRFTSEETYTHENITLIGALLENVFALNTVEVLFPQLLNIAVDKAAESDMDITFIKDNYSVSEFQADLPQLVDVAHKLVDFGMFKLLGENKGEAVIDLEYIAQAIEILGSVTILTKFAPEWTVLGLNKINEVEAIAEYGIIIDKAEYMFTPDQWVEENETLQAIVRKIDEFLTINNLITASEIKAYVQEEGRFTSEETYTHENVTLIGELLQTVLELHTIEPLFPQLLSVVVD